MVLTQINSGLSTLLWPPPVTSIPFNDDVAQKYGDIRADLEKKRTPIGPYDLQIASIACVNNLTLITHNTKEFNRVVGLKIEINPNSMY